MPHNKGSAAPAMHDSAARSSLFMGKSALFGMPTSPATPPRSPPVRRRAKTSAAALAIDNTEMPTTPVNANTNSTAAPTNANANAIDNANTNANDYTNTSTPGEPPSGFISGLRKRRASDSHDGAAAVRSETRDPLSETATLMSNMEAQWARRKTAAAQWMSARLRSPFDGEDGDGGSASAPASPVPAPRASETSSTCHVCNTALRLYRLRHRCRNCGLAVCGVHSKNQVPLPHLGIMKQVRVCDICTRALVQRRAGYRSPKSRSSRANPAGVGAPLASSSATARLSLEDAATPPTSPSQLLPLSFSLPTSSTPTLDDQQLVDPAVGVSTAVTASPSAAKHSQLGGVLYSCLLEEQANIMDELLYLGTFTMGGRALASRHMTNVAIWKDRWFMLTSAELLCFKAAPSNNTDTHATGNGNTATGGGGASANDDNKTMTAALGELRSSVHLTDILHIEVNEQYPRILTVIRSDGRVFRVRARNAEQCSEIAAALRIAQQLFQDAMHKLQRGPQPEDYSISCVTIQHESSLPESVVSFSPLLKEPVHVRMYPSSILRFYVNGPDTNGVAQYSCQMIESSLTGTRNGIGLAREDKALISAEADPLRSSPGDTHLLRVLLRPLPVPTIVITEKKQKAMMFWGVLVGLISVGSYLNQRQQTSLEVVVWLLALVLTLTRFHDPLMLLVTTKRLHRSKEFCVACEGISHTGKSGLGGLDTTDGDINAADNEEAEVDPRFLAGCNGDVSEAKQRYAETMAWRRDEEVDSILLRPLPQFAAMKASYTHFVHKKGRQGHLVSYDHFGYTKKMREDFLARGVSERDAVRHNVFLQEFLWNVVDPREFPEGTQIKVVDIKGVSMGDVSGDVFHYMKALGTTIAEYNPERMFQIFIVNPPSWFNLIWKVVSPSINPKTRERVHVLRGHKDISKALLEFVAPENLPVEYGGTCSCAGGCFTHSPEENDLRDYVENVLNVMEEGDPRIQQALDALKDKYQRQLAPFASEDNTSSPTNVATV